MQEEFEVGLESVSPLLENQFQEIKKTKGESHEEVSLRIWKKKAYAENDGSLYFPGDCFVKAMAACIYDKPFKIESLGAKAGKARVKRLICSTIMCEDFKFFKRTPIEPDEVLPEEVPFLYKCHRLTLDDTTPLKSVVHRGGEGCKVPTIRPLIKEWVGILEITTFDKEALPKKLIIDVLKWCGQFNGIGDWRPSCGGIYGRFKVV